MSHSPAGTGQGSGVASLVLNLCPCLPPGLAATPWRTSQPRGWPRGCPSTSESYSECPLPVVCAGLAGWGLSGALGGQGARRLRCPGFEQTSVFWG